MKSKFSQRFFSPSRKPIYMDLDNPIFRIYSPTSMSAVQPSQKNTSSFIFRTNKPKSIIRNLLLKKSFVQKNISSASNSKSSTPVSRLIMPQKLLNKNFDSIILKTNFKEKPFNAERLFKKKVRISPSVLPKVNTKKQMQVINLADLVRFTNIDEELSDRGKNNFNTHLPSLANRPYDPYK